MKPINLNKDIVPFGKYKGQPVEVMQNDAEYCDWLMSQDWFRDRHAPIYQLIVNNFGEASETPEHNKLQTLFLDDAICYNLLCLLKCECAVEYEKVIADELKNVLSSKAKNIEKLESEIKEKQERIVSYNKDILKYPDDDYWKGLALKKEKEINQLRNDITKIEGYIQYWNNSEKIYKHLITNRKFEENGWDVNFTHELTCNGYDFRTQKSTCFIEIKPCLGDDYPAVLRQMKNNCSAMILCSDGRTRRLPIAADYKVLVFETFTATGATIENVKQIFNESGFYVIQLSELKGGEA